MAYKDKRSVLFVIMLVSLMIFLTACGGQRGRDEPQFTQFVASGTEGLIFNFVPDQPPNRIFEETPIDVLIEVQNRGTFTIPTANFYLTGYDPAIVSMSGGPVPLSGLEGKSNFQPQGGIDTISFSSSNIILPQGMNSYRPRFLLTACYPYQTVANPVVCIDPRPQDTLSDKACVAQRTYPVGAGQGAPVGIAALEAESTPSGTLFRIHVQNFQPNGVSYSSDAIGKCPSGLEYRDLNRIRYQVSLSDGRITGDCKPTNGELRLINGRGTIFCKFANVDAQGGLAYQTPLRVTLDYGYKNSISKDIEIQSLN